MGHGDATCVYLRLETDLDSKEAALKGEPVWKLEKLYLQVDPGGVGGWITH